MTLRPWRTPRHLREINRRLVRVATGRTDRLAVCMPPRHGKSLLISQFFPAWFLLVYPWQRVILCSYEADFAAQWGRKVRDVVTQWGPLFGVHVRADSKAADRWEIAGHGGGMQTAGVGGPVLGKGADLLVLDDLTKNAQEALSPTHRAKAWDWLTSTAFTRLEPGGRVVNVQQRWHTDDVTGKLVRSEPARWDVLTLPALAEDGDPLGRRPGEALWPERYPAGELESRRTLAPVWFAAQYQQRPIDLEGGFFKGVERIPLLSAAPTPDQFARRIRAWDLACLVGGTRVATLRGDVPIEDVRPGDYALTRSGYKRVLWAGLTKYTRDLVRMRLNNGAELVGTADHKMWTENRGWVELGCVVRGDYSLCSHGGAPCLTNTSAASPTPKSSSFRGRTTPGGRGRSITRRGGMTVTPASSGRTPSTGRCGGITTAPSPPATTFTMWTGTTTTTPPKTWHSFPEAITPSCTTISPRSTPDRTPTRSGEGRWRSGGHRRYTNNTHASIVAPTSSLAASTFHPSSVASVAAVTTTDSCGVPVYDLEVEDAHEFFANGVLVHNCTEAQSGADPDYTVGVLMGRHRDGTFWVLDVARERLGPAGVRALIRQTAEADGSAVPVRIEREGGASGKIAAADIVARDLAGFVAQAVRAKGSKAERAEPFAAQVEAGNVRVVRNRHTPAVLDEMRAFPTGAHDDAVDAMSLAFGEVARPAGGWSLGGEGGSLYGG